LFVKLRCCARCLWVGRLVCLLLGSRSTSSNHCDTARQVTNVLQSVLQFPVKRQGKEISLNRLLRPWWTGFATAEGLGSLIAGWSQYMTATVCSVCKIKKVGSHREPAKVNYGGLLASFDQGRARDCPTAGAFNSRLQTAFDARCCWFQDLWCCVEGVTVH
jgi:hypothetical protein